jgi:hypothetical protein
MPDLLLKDSNIYICGFSGLPDGIFENQKYHCGYILEGLGLENVIGIFYGNLMHFMALWYILWYIFYRFGMSYQEKSGSPVDSYQRAVLNGFPSLRENIMRR